MSDRPIPGRVYALTGDRSINAGDTWQGSEVFCAGVRQDHMAQGCTNRLDHEHHGRDLMSHSKGRSIELGCTPYRCAVQGNGRCDECRRYLAGPLDGTCYDCATSR